jgi:hypothetical protein
MRPVCVFANGPDSEIELLRGDLHGLCTASARPVAAGRLLLPAPGYQRPRSWGCRLRQIHSFFCNRSPGQMLATAPGGIRDSRDPFHAHFLRLVNPKVRLTDSDSMAGPPSHMIKLTVGMSDGQVARRRR